MELDDQEREVGAKEVDILMEKGLQPISDTGSVTAPQPASPKRPKKRRGEGRGPDTEVRVGRGLLRNTL
jgi:hypothetical protein